MATRNGDKLSDTHITALQSLSQQIPRTGWVSELPAQPRRPDHFHGQQGSANSLHPQPLGHFLQYQLVGILLSGNLSTDVSYQLPQLYKLKASTQENGKDYPHFPVNLVTIPQQEDSKDCGVFAIAYAYHATPKYEITVRQDLMRRHLEARVLPPGKTSSPTG